MIRSIEWRLWTTLRRNEIGSRVVDVRAPKFELIRKVDPSDLGGNGHVLRNVK